MLVYFKVANYRSIREPLTINFEATGISEHADTNVLTQGKVKLLKTILLYGPNAGGKSNVMDAFVKYRMLILRSASYNSTKALPVIPFLLSTETRENPTFFESEFVLENKRYRYGYEVTRSKVLREWLLEVKATTQSPVFLRIGQDFQVNYKKFVNAEGVEKKCNENALFLSVCDQWNVDVAKSIYKWFDNVFTVHGLGDGIWKSFTNELFENEVYRDEIDSLMRHADLGINSLQVVDWPAEEGSDEHKNERSPEGEDDEYRSSKVLTGHDVYDGNGDKVEVVYFNMDGMASEGTKKFYNILGALLYAIRNGNLVVIDEMDARLHTLLTKSIVRLFNGESSNTGAQLFAACHDTAVMDGDLLRRDQVYLVEKDQYSGCKAVNLSEYKTARKETPLNKNYLEGRYGGIPFIENFENFLQQDVKKQKQKKR